MVHGLPTKALMGRSSPTPFDIRPASHPKVLLRITENNEYCYSPPIIGTLVESGNSFRSTVVNVSLTPELEELVNEKVRSGMYHSASEVIREGLRLLKEQDEVRKFRLGQLSVEVDAGIGQIERGNYTDYNADNMQPLFDEVKSEGRKRLANRSGDTRD